MNRKLDSVWWALRIGLGLGPLLAGLDKFFNLLLTNWSMYLSPLAESLLPVSGDAFMQAVGVVEMEARELARAPQGSRTGMLGIPRPEVEA